jgi:coronin-7
LFAQQNSFADRRRIYEFRSQSVAEEKKITPDLRRDSLKLRSDIKSYKDNSNAPDVTKFEENHDNGVRNTTSKRISTVFGKVSKYRHLKGTTLHKSTHVENLKNISRQIPGECDGFHCK